MKLTLLGCGTSSGVPRIGNDWGACDPAEPRNRRTRASIIVETASTRILVDTSPDLREQLLAADVADVDAILWTHDHADHCHGIDDVRQIFHYRGSPVPAYARRQTLDHLRCRFEYVFEGRDGYPPTVAAAILSSDMTIGDIRIRSVDQPHGHIYSTGFRFENGSNSISYSTDFHQVTKEMLALFAGTEVWVVDALRVRPHPTHPHLALTLGAIETVAPKQAILTHMDQSMDYARLLASLPAGVVPGFDGMTVELT